MNPSEFKFFSIGTVVANKALGSNEIEVNTLEVSTTSDGELTDTGVVYATKGTTAEGETYTAEVPTSRSVKASWLPIGNGNRLTSPDVRRGERVIVYRYGNADAFYWEEAPENTVSLRKLETIVWGISATKDESAKASAKNTYYIELSSHNKLVHLHTSNADGEPFAYDIQLNTKDGNFQINDNAGTIISLDSKEREIELINADKSTVVINKRGIRIFAEDSIDIKTNKLNIEADTITTHAAKNNITAMTKHVGNIQLLGGMSQTGGGGTGGGAGVEFDSDMKVTGATEFTNDMNVTGTLTADKIVTPSNIDAPNV